MPSAPPTPENEAPHADDAEWDPHALSREDSGEDDLDMTPMVDVTFLLLIFFMITAAFALQKAIQTPPTNDDKSAAVQTLDELEADSIVVRIDGDNVYWIGCPAWPDERRAASRQDMRAQVKAARGGDGSSGYNRMLVQASGDATHEFVVAALDAGSGVGVEEIRLMRFDDPDE